MYGQWKHEASFSNKERRKNQRQIVTGRDVARRITGDPMQKRIGFVYGRGDIVWQEPQIRDGQNGGDAANAVISRCIS